MSRSAEDHTLLQQYFKTIIEGKDLLIEVRHLKIIIELLGFPTDRKIFDILTECFTYYVQVWPGWSSSKEHTSQFDNCFKKFQHYIILKMNEILQDETIKNILLCDKACNINISGPAKILDAIQATREKDLILLEHYTMNKSKSIISNQALLNLPYFGVEVNTPYLSFVRRNVFKISRFITTAKRNNLDQDQKFLESIIQTNIDNHVISHKALNNYNEGLNYLKARYTKNDTLNFKLTEITSIFKQFLSDIYDINVHNRTIATNANICYNIGGNQYMKNQKHYYEVITPKIEFNLKKFSDTSTDRSLKFKSLNEYKQDVNLLIKDFVENTDVIKYSCLFCNINFSAMTDILHHFQFEHFVHYKVTCLTCDSATLPISNLAVQRWRPYCHLK